MNHLSEYLFNNYKVTFLNSEDKNLQILVLEWATLCVPVLARILEEEFPGDQLVFREPIVELIPLKGDETEKFERSATPIGPTSLLGKEYKRPGILASKIFLHPNAPYKFFTFVVYDLDEEIFRGHYHVEDIFAHVIDFIAKELLIKDKDLYAPDSKLFYKVEPTKGFDIATSEKYNLLPQDNIGDAALSGAFQVPILKPERKRISFKKVAESPFRSFPPEQFHNTLTQGRGKEGQGRVILQQAVYDHLCYELSLSRTDENGGYLIGFAYRDPDSPIDQEDADVKWIIEITDVIPAEGTFGNPGLLLFTGETWSRMNRRIKKEFPDKLLLSWYHTHLFPGSDDFGLSSLDQTLHKQFFKNPWQVAILLNIDYDGVREIRCFQRGTEGNFLVESTYELSDEKAIKTIS